MLGVPSGFILPQVTIVFGVNPQHRARSCASTMKLLVVHKYKCEVSSAISRVLSALSSAIDIEP
jgi:hypothetical protein